MSSVNANMLPVSDIQSRNIIDESIRKGKNSKQIKKLRLNSLKENAESNEKWLSIAKKIKIVKPMLNHGIRGKHVKKFTKHFSSKIINAIRNMTYIENSSLNNQNLSKSLRINDESEDIGRDAYNKILDYLPLRDVLSLRVSNQQGKEDVNEYLIGRINREKIHLNDLGSNSLNKFLSFFGEKAKDLTYFDLGRFSLHDEDFEKLIQHSPKIESLVIKNNLITNKRINQIAMLTQLTELVLHNSLIGDEGAIAITENLPQLRKLNLSKNRIRFEGAKAIAQNLPQLRELDLSDNKIKDEGVIAIAKKLTQLIKLVLSRNSITDIGAIAIADNIPQLITLELSASNIGVEGAKAIAKKLPQLIKLDLCGSSIGVKGAIAIAYNLPQLRELDLAGNYIGDEGAKVIVEKLPQLIKLDLRCNRIGDEYGKAIAKMFKMGRFILI